MAAMVAARTSISAGGPRPASNLPVIEHPMSRMATLVDIEVKGESTSAPPMGGLGRRAKTLLAFTEHAHSLPPLSERLASRGSTRMESYRDPDVYGTRVPGDKGKFRTSAHLQPRYTIEELLFMIQERLATGVHALKHLFMSHDHSGEARVSRQALQRILHSLVGYVGGEQFNRLLRRLGLENRTNVSCDEFVACFAENELQRSREYITAVQKKEIQEHPEEHLRNSELELRGEYVTAPYCLTVLREQFRKNDGTPNIFNFLPTKCSDAQGRVHSLHLYHVICQCGLLIDDVELKKLWDRFDTQAAGVVATAHFLKVLGLDETGQPRPLTTPRYILMSKDNDTVLKKVKGASPPPHDADKRITLPPIQEKDLIRTSATPREEPAPPEVLDCEPEATTDEKPKSPTKVKRQHSKLRSKAPKLEKIVDCLFYKFEENHNAISQGFEVLDFLGDGYISRVDFKLVLQEFGLRCQATDLEHFLSKCGIRGVRGQVNFREFLSKFWNKTDSGIVHRIITSRHHVFGRADHFNPDTRTDETKSVENLESKMVEFFHKDFLNLLGMLKKCDKYNIGVITQYEFKEAVERTLGYSMSDSQWAELKDIVGLDPDGLVPYPKFLEKFSAPPGQWNRRQVGEFWVRQITTNTMAPAVERIKVYSAQYKAERDAQRTACDDQTALDVIKDVIEKREAGVEEEEVEVKTTPRTVSGGEGTQERVNAEEAAAMMSKMLDKPLVNQVSEMKAGPRPAPFTPEGQVHNLLQRGPDRMATPRGPHQMIDRSHRERSTDELNELVCVLVRFKFHRLDKTFKAMDRKMTGRFHRGQFTTMLQDCDVYLSADEMNRLWATYPVSADGMFSFSTLVRHYIDYTPKHAPVSRENTQLEPESTNVVEQVRYKQKERRLSRLRDIKVPVIGREKTVIKERDEVVEKIKSQVVSQWAELKNILRQADQSGAATIPMHHMKDIVKRLQWNLTEDETHDLLHKFDFHGNGDFHYIEFLKMYTDRACQEQLLPKQARYTALSYRLEKRLIKDWKNIRRAFRRFDTEGAGHLKVTDFRAVLRSCGVQVSDEDLYHILSEFDVQMNGRISYEHFLATLLSCV